MPEAGQSERNPAANPVPATAPETATPFQWNQQVNIQQLPPDLWHRLPPDQLPQVLRMILDQTDQIDQRHFQFATEQAKRSHNGERLRVVLGSVAYLVLLGTAAVLALSGHALVAGIIAATAGGSLLTIFGRWLL